MRILLESDHPCPSSTRIERALARQAPPGVSVIPAGTAGGYQTRITEAERQADLVLIHVGGRWTQVRNRIARFEDAGIRYAILQLVIRNTQHPNTADWLPFWQGAKFVWSYYDLCGLCADDDVDPEGVVFYRSPLGVDPYLTERISPAGPRHITALAEGDNDKLDNIRQIYRAVRRSGGRMIHLGPEIVTGRWITRKQGIPDDALLALYAQTKFVTCLRSTEGFELCAAEGIFAGARPVLFDRQHHRDWFGDLAEYIPEDDTDLLVNWLMELFKEGPRPIEADEYDEAKARFDWGPIANGFWKLCLT